MVLFPLLLLTLLSTNLNSDVMLSRFVESLIMVTIVNAIETAPTSRSKGGNHLIKPIITSTKNKP